ncbi:hypothetical protein L2E82_35986 [Cichorium intybus]|uniref:Uncharacterized protein n=1 Tax=Cichorium intybus TaxID=13427 RepID=A0ACB9BQ99_CICIN|nr:hypothetical protein L2E82_35986 [Cichorium intybus]
MIALRPLLFPLQAIVIVNFTIDLVLILISDPIPLISTLFNVIYREGSKIEDKEVLESDAFYVPSVNGSRAFRREKAGIKVSDVSKKLGKKFATGASVVKGATKKEQIDVQADIAYDIHGLM